MKHSQCVSETKRASSVWRSLLSLKVVCTFALLCVGLSPTSSPAQSISADAFKVEQGFNAAWKVGFETSVVVSGPKDIAKDLTAEIVTADGDGVTVMHRAAMAQEYSDAKSDSDQATASLLVRHGRANR